MWRRVRLLRPLKGEEDKGCTGLWLWQQCLFDDRFWRYLREADDASGPGSGDTTKLRRYIWEFLRRYEDDCTAGNVSEQLAEAVQPSLRVFRGLAVLIDPMPLQSSWLGATKEDFDFICPPNATSAPINKQVAPLDSWPLLVNSLECHCGLLIV